MAAGGVNIRRRPGSAATCSPKGCEVLAPAPDPDRTISRIRTDTDRVVRTQEDLAQARALKPDGLRYLGEGVTEKRPLGLARRWDRGLQCGSWHRAETSTNAWMQSSAVIGRVTFQPSPKSSITTSA